MRDQAPPSTAPARPTAEQRRGAESTGGDLAAPQPDAAPSHPGVQLSPPGVISESDVRTHSPGAAHPQQRLGIWAEELGELPWSYGDGRMVTLLRDPRTIYVYWDLSQGQVDQAFAGLGEARAELRLWSSGQGAELLREIEVQLEARGWYVRELPPGLDLKVELWAIGERGARMIRAARPVRLPPAEPSNVWDEIYVTLPLGRRLGRGESLTGGQALQWRAGQSAPEVPPRTPQRFLGSSERPSGAAVGGEPGTGSGGLSRRNPDDQETK